MLFLQSILLLPFVESPENLKIENLPTTDFRGVIEQLGWVKEVCLQKTGMNCDHIA